MASRLPARQPAAEPEGDDERSLLGRLESMLDHEESLLVARDAAGLAALAEEREHVAERLGRVARARRPGADPSVDADLLKMYERLRQRHDVQAQVVQRHVERTGRAINVLAQATGQGNLYNADGRVAMQFASA